MILTVGLCGDEKVVDVGGPAYLLPTVNKSKVCVLMVVNRFRMRLCVRLYVKEFMRLTFKDFIYTLLKFCESQLNSAISTFILELSNLIEGNSMSLVFKSYISSWMLSSGTY